MKEKEIEKILKNPKRLNLHLKRCSKSNAECEICRRASEKGLKWKGNKF